MIKIGDFARLGNVSIVTLRHYDEVGLLPPVAVDAVTGYRYYSTAQLPRLHCVIALKGLGFSLEQIAQMLQGGLTMERLRRMLTLKQAEVEQHIASEQRRLVRIAARLRQIEGEDCPSGYDVVLKSVPSLLVAARRVTIPRNDEVPQYLGAALAEASSHVKRQGAKATGPDVAVWHQAAAVHVNEQVDAAVPIDRPIPSTDRVLVFSLPPAQVASIVHHGEFDDFTRGHAALLTWISANSYRLAGPYREIYINHHPRNMAEAATEIQYPVEQAV